MNWQILSALIAAVSCFSIGGFVYFRNRKGSLNKFFFLSNIGLGIWNLGDFFVNLSKTLPAALFWDRFSYVGAIFMVPFFVRMVFSLVEVKDKKIIHKIFLAFFVSANLLALTALFSPLIIREVSIVPFKEFTGPLYFLFTLFFLGGLGYGLVCLWRSYRKTEGLKRNQLRYMFLGIFVGSIAAIIYFLTFISEEVPPIHYFVEIGYALILAYAIVKYRLMDIKVAVTRTAIFVIVYILVLGIPLGLTGWGRPWLISIFDQGWFWLPMLILLGLATSGPFIFIYLRRRAEDILLKDQMRYQKELKEFASSLIFIRDAKELTQKLNSEIMDSVSLDFCAVYLKQDQDFYLINYQSKSSLALPQKIDSNSLFIDSLKERNQPTLGEHFPKLENLKLGLASALFLKGEFSGFILLGQKTKGMFTEMDLDLFSIISSQASLALSEIYYFEDYQRVTEEKFQLILEKERLKAASEISEVYCHELGNIMNNISLASFILTNEPTEEDIEKASKAIQGNIRRSKVILDTLGDYKGKQNSVFKLLDLDKVLKEEIDKQKEAISKNNINLETHIEDKTIEIFANDNLRDCLKYLIDGSIRAMHNYQPKERNIFIDLKKENNSALLIISDTAKDVTTDILYKGFTIERGQEGGLFYFIARRIIFDHKGSFEINSFEERKGTSFIIRLPLKKIASQ